MAYGLGHCWVHLLFCKLLVIMFTVEHNWTTEVWMRPITVTLSLLKAQQNSTAWTEMASRLKRMLRKVPFPLIKSVMDSTSLFCTFLATFYYIMRCLLCWQAHTGCWCPHSETHPNKWAIKKKKEKKRNAEATTKVSTSFTKYNKSSKPSLKGSVSVWQSGRLGRAGPLHELPT